MLTKTNIIERTKKEEGYRSHLYDDGKDNQTIGYGWNIQEIGCPEPIAEYAMNYFLDLAIKDLYENFKWFPELPDKIQEVLVDMCYNMGITTLKKFKNMIGFFAIHDYERAADEIKDSAYYRDPLTHKRASRNVYIVSGGKMS